MDICSFCLQPGNVFPTGVPSQFACVKCQPYINTSSEMSYGNPSIARLQTSGSGGPFTCKYCNKNFDKNLQYQNHLRNHSAERKFVCPRCSKAFSQSNNLRAHLRIHTNERPFKCQECGKAFTQITNLNNHMRLHTGEKPFVCKEPGCSRAFAQVTNLNNHKKSHMKEFVTFKCSYCSRTFAQRNHLVTHVQTEHEDQVCNPCGETFPSSAALVAHTKYHCRERNSHHDKRTLHNTSIMMENSVKRKVHAGSGERVKCLFGECNLYFDSMSILQAHLASKHGISINKGYVVDVEDYQSPSKSTTSSHKYRQNDIRKSSPSSDSEEETSIDKREYDRRKNDSHMGISHMKMVCNVCFDTFDDSRQLEKHMRKNH